MTSPTPTTKQNIVTQPAPEAAWQSLRGCLRERFGETSFRRWLEPVAGSAEKTADGILVLTLTLPTRFMRDWVEGHYGDAIRALWGQLVGSGRVEFVVLSPLKKSGGDQKSPEAPAAFAPAAE